MRLESRTWFGLSLLFLAGAVYFWHRGNEYQKSRSLSPASPRALTNVPAGSNPSNAPIKLLSQFGPAQSGSVQPKLASVTSPAGRGGPTDPPPSTNGVPRRLTNTAQPMRQLAHKDTAILMRNALIDTALGTDLPIPQHLRVQGDPASYIVQARGAIQQAFRARLQQAGATVVSYIPNNAYLVELSGESARQLAAQPEVQAVLPYQPYFKLDGKLLALAADQKPLAEEDWLRVTTFPDQRDAAAQGITALGGELISEDRTPFGQELLVKPTPDSLPALARLPSVQTIERFHSRKLMNDQTRVIVGLSPDGASAVDYLNLTGTNILVNMNDSGVDATHPDLQGRIFGETTNVLVDVNGHGTHVAGTIAGNGSVSSTVGVTPIGSDTNANYRGMAPAAEIFTMLYQPFPLPNNPVTDTYLQEAAAQTNVLYSHRPGAPMISNNSWGYVGANEYDSSSARFDAAVRNAIPDSTNSQAMIFVFAAGNSGGGDDNGQGGDLDTIPSPANAKNVIAVGAVETFRNVTNAVLTTNIDGTISTNAPFLGMTDATDEVAAFSSRGNSGVNIEGDFGRFKPDLVAPGTFIISTRSKDWKLENDVDTNTPQYQILKDLNEPLAPFYRFESGTSQAAPTVSGLLALMQEFFEQRLPAGLRRTNSPALMKALLINGARSLGPLYSLEVQNSINYQGWGLVNITNSLPALMASQPESRWPIRFFDQSATNAVATDQSKSWTVALSTNAQQVPLRVTLVWTDPPGNPAAAIKLVNNLDLVVSNTVSHEVYYGNNIPTESDFTAPSAPDESPVLDVVNNVENVYIREPGSSNFVVSVIGRRVNVAANPDYNRVTGQINDVVQDYALVISCGDTTLTNALSVSPVTPEPTQPGKPVVVMTNGVPLINERVGANASMLTVTNGITNQWNFYVFTNLFLTNGTSTLTNGTNVAFVTFLPPNLGRPRNLSADIDLYVSKDPGLTNLTATALEGAWKSVSRSGTESVVFTNAALGDVYYVGVKSEDQEGGEYSLIALSSDQPFEENQNGTRVLHGMPVPQPIPDGTAARPGRATIIAVGISPIVVRHVAVSTVLTHQDLGDLSLILSHESATAVLHSHSLNNDQFAVTNLVLNYDDSGFGSGVGTRRSSGPGNLNNFVGTQGNGVWLFNAVDNAPGNVGQIQNVTIRLDPFQNGNLAAAGAAGIRGNVLPHDVASYFIDVPPDATNMIVHLSQVTGPLEVYLGRGSMPTTNIYDKSALISPPGGDVSLSASDLPFPLASGRYFLALFNPSDAVIDFLVSVSFEFGTGLDVQRTLTTTNAVPLLDNGVVVSTLNLPVDKEVAEVQVAVRIDHPRSSDLVLHLISPQGTRILLAENRGGIESRGYGAGTGTNMTYTIFTENTNLVADLQPVKYALPPWPNPADTATNGASFLDSFEGALPGRYVSTQAVSAFTVTSGAVVVRTNGEAIGVAAHTGTNFVELDPSAGPAAMAATFPTVPGKEYVLNFRYQRHPSATAGTPETLQVYYGPPALVRPPSTSLDVRNFGWDATNIVFKAFGDQTQLEFSSTNTFGPLLDTVRVTDLIAATNVYVLPEEPLTQLQGERAMGDWKLEIWDNRSGPPGAGPGSLLNWQLLVKYGNPAGKANLLANGLSYSGTISGSETNYFVVDVCESANVAFATLTGAFEKLKLLVNRTGIPSGDFEKDEFSPITNNLAIDDTLDTGLATFKLDTNPHYPAPLVPGKQLYFAVQNVNPDETNTFDFQVSFDRDTCTGERPVIVLENDVPYTNVVAPSSALFDYYVFTVSPTATRAQFEVTPRNGDVGMVLRYGLPLPVLTNFDYLSDRVGITNELIVLTNGSSPVPLLPGDWYIGVYNNSTNAVVYNVRASEVLDTNVSVIVLTNAIPLNYTLQQGLGLTNYFLFRAPPGTKGVQFDLYDLNGDADLRIGYNRLPTGTNVFMSNSASPALPLTVQIQTNATQRSVSGNWVLSVAGRTSNSLQFTLRATLLGTTNQVPGTNRIFDPNLAVTGTNLCLSWAATVGYQYQLEGKKTVVDADWGLLFGPATATNTLMEFCMGLPNPYSFFRVIETQTGSQTNQNQGTVTPALTASTNEICLTWISQIGAAYQVRGKTGVTDSVWANISDRIVATNTTTRFCIPRPTPYQFFAVMVEGGGTNLPTTVIPLENKVAYTNTISTAGTLDYYVFNVSPGAIQAQFQLQPTNGDVGMVLRYGLPLPVLTNFDYIVDRPGITNGTIVLTNSSSPIPLQPGDWYIGVFNNSTKPVSYSVQATETLDPKLNIIPLTNGIPLNFTIRQGAGLTNFFLFKVTNEVTGLQFRLFDLTANADLLIGANQLPNYNAYLIGNSGNRTSPLTIEVHTNATLSQLNGNWVLSVINKELTNLSFTVQASLIGTITTNNPPPTGTNTVTTSLRVDTNGPCLSWPSQVGSNYVVVAKVGITDLSWTNVSGTITATGKTTTYCLPKTTPYRFFEVFLSGGGAPETPPATNGVAQVALTVSTNGPCLTWVSQTGSNYVVAAKVGITDLSWTNVSGTITATGKTTTYCLPKTTPYHFFEVFLSGGGTPETPPVTNGVPRITLAVSTNGPCLTWASQVGSNYLVTAKASITDAAWTNVSGTITATGKTTTYCLPKATPYHFFEVFLSGGGTPETPPSTNTTSVARLVLAVSTNGPCLAWDSQVGSSYVVAAKAGIMDTAWTNVSGTITANSARTTYCLPKTTPYHFFFVMPSGSSTNTGGTGGGSTNRVTLHTPATLLGGRMQFTWPALPNVTYEVQYTTNLTPVIKWITLTNLPSSTGTGTVTFTDNSRVTNGPPRFYRVVEHTAP